MEACSLRSRFGRTMGYLDLLHPIPLVGNSGHELSARLIGNAFGVRNTSMMAQYDSRFCAGLLISSKTLKAAFC